MKYSGKTFFTFMLCGCLILMTAGCSEKTAQGRITAIDGDSVTFTLGTFTEMAAPDGEKGETPPDNENGAPPEKPDNSDEAPADGEQNNTPPQTEPSAATGTFTAGDDSLTLDITKATITLSDGSKGSVDDLKAGNIITVTYKSDLTASSLTVDAVSTMDSGEAGETNNENQSADLTAANTADGEEQALAAGEYNSEKSDEGTLLAKNGGSLTAEGATVTKTGDSSDVNSSNFTGLNAAVCAANDSEIILSKATVTSEGEGANAIFATGEGSKITVSDTTISTTGNSARGLDATYNGTIDATNMDITTKGSHCAPVATDRGEGTVTVEDSTLKASGDGSPCIYSTGDISAESVTGVATQAQTAVIEGKNSISLKYCNLTGAGENGVMIYQSTSGDAAEGVGLLQAYQTTLTTTSKGPMFYITNTDAKISLNQVTLDFGSATLLEAAGNETNNWGNPGKNGGNVTLAAKYQILNGDILCDEISAVTMNIAYHSTYEGTINGGNSGGNVVCRLGGTATLTLTGDSYVSVFIDKDKSVKNVISNGHTLYYDNDNEANAWLNGKTIDLTGGGSLTPMNS